MPTETFRSHRAMMKNLAYRNMHGVPVTATTICIREKDGRKKCHRVKPSRNPVRRKIDARQRRKVAREHKRETRRR